MPKRCQGASKADHLLITFHGPVSFATNSLFALRAIGIHTRECPNLQRFVSEAAAVEIQDWLKKCTGSCNPSRNETSDSGVTK
jgi:hypothetical protein